MPAWVDEVLSLSLALTQPQLLGLAFLLGSFAVASLSDLKRLSAQREFLEVWILFTLGVLAYDGITLWQAGWQLWPVAVAKWTAIAVLGALSWERVGAVFSLARADVWACTAAASLLSPLLVLGFWLVLKLVAGGLRPLLARGAGPWPFMPVVTLSVVLVGLGGMLAPGGNLALFGWL
ncbi:hypothetical protein BRD56_12005 [Thermoplasmatales archaeon SW_10_69_26]|jgi:hypothetical protein|nr:MAG: hypothetical protein BRD56_12005 [Thermoplasmatales archaeon SW_10_69_26]